MDFIEGELASLKRFGLLRQLRTLHSASEPEIEMDGRRVLHFSSNNYLGLATHPGVKRAAAEAIEKYGTGAGASRLISGNMDVHTRLERALAGLKGTEAALVYATGSMANLGVIPCLVGPKDLVLLDELDHATLHDGVRLSRAEVRLFKHNDLEDLEAQLKQAAGRRCLVAVDGVFSMDGDLAPLPGIAALARRHGAMTLVDEAHATLVLGDQGRGTLEHFGMRAGDIDVQVGTLSKALGSLGGFVACSAALRDLLINKSRAFIFATGLPPACAAAALAAIEIAGRQPELRQAVWSNRRVFMSAVKDLGLDTFGSVTPIIPLKVGRPEAVLQAQARLLEEGIFVPAIRPPTVSKDSCRLRLSLTSAHTQAQVERAARALAQVFNPA